VTPTKAHNDAVPRRPTSASGRWNSVVLGIVAMNDHHPLSREK
jgi:hypothetical protein